MLLRVRAFVLLVGPALLGLIVLPQGSRAGFPAPLPAHSSVHNHRRPAPLDGVAPALAAVGAPTVCGVTGGLWTDRAATPAPIDGTALVALGGSVYSFGGFDGTGNVTSVYRYDPPANSWTARAPLPAPRAGLSAVTDGTAIYLLNGYGATVGGSVAGLWRYDPGTDSYDTNLAAPTLDTGDQGAAYLGGRLYRIGGYSASLATDTPTVEVYTIGSNSWTTTTTYPFPIDGLATVVLNGAIYTAGGYNAGTGAASDKTYRYLPAAPGWDDAAIADLPAVRVYAAAGVLAGQVVLAAGGDLATVYSSATAWDPTANAWAALPPLTHGRDLTAGAVVGSAFYVVGGDDSSQQPTNFHERYSITPCATATVTATPAVTATPTATGTPTVNGTATATITATATASRTPSPTATPSATATAIPDVTASVTASLTATPSLTPSLTATITPSLSATPSRTASAATPTLTITTGFTPTATATATIPATGTATRTAGPLPTATANNNTPTGTATGTATITPAPSATAGICTIRFNDVPYNDPTIYYSVPVYYLACRGIISGYNDGNFRPYNTTTRAQTAKIVAGGFGVPAYTPPGGYTFADVLPGSTFYSYVEAVAHAGIVSGYTCGGTNPAGGAEPCDNQQRPYFRPSNLVTRGQIAKLIALAAVWPLLTPPMPTFSDVPPGSIFFTVIQTAVCHGAISGYDDHTFRPANNATRGQIAKIAYLALNDSSGCRTVR